MSLTAPLVSVLCLLLLTVACHRGDDRELELGYLRPVVAPEIIDRANIEVAGLEHLRLAEVAGERCLGLRVFAGQEKKNNGVRAELSIDFPYRIGDVVRYRWRFLIPEDFQSDAPANRWWVLADWHDQPNRDRGETWDGFPARSAPIIVGYGQRDGHDLISLSYGSPDSRPVAVTPVTRGRWHELVALIAWSRGADGHAELRLDGATEPWAAANGPNMHNDFQHYAKIGQYRHPDIAGDSWIHLTGVEIVNLGTMPRGTVPLSDPAPASDSHR